MPVFAFQIPFIMMSKKMGHYAIITFGTFLSAGAVLCFLYPNPGLLFLVFGLINSTGYAAGMPLSQAVFSEMYNEHYAKKYNLVEIDSHTSAAPLKILINLANVLGLVIGGTILTLGF